MGQNLKVREKRARRKRYIARVNAAHQAAKKSK